METFTASKIQETLHEYEDCLATKKQAIAASRPEIARKMVRTQLVLVYRSQKVLFSLASANNLVRETTAKIIPLLRQLEDVLQQQQTQITTALLAAEDSISQDIAETIIKKFRNSPIPSLISRYLHNGGLVVMLAFLNACTAQLTHIAPDPGASPPIVRSDSLMPVPTEQLAAALENSRSLLGPQEYLLSDALFAAVSHFMLGSLNDATAFYISANYPKYDEFKLRLLDFVLKSHKLSQQEELQALSLVHVRDAIIYSTSVLQSNLRKNVIIHERMHRAISHLDDDSNKILMEAGRTMGYRVFAQREKYCTRGITLSVRCTIGAQAAHSGSEFYSYLVDGSLGSTALKELQSEFPDAFRIFDSLRAKLLAQLPL